MTLNTHVFADFPFYPDAREYFLKQHTLEDALTETVLDNSISRIVKTIHTDETPPSYNSPMQFKTFIGTKTLLTEIDSPLYSYLFFRNESKRILRQYDINVIAESIGVEIHEYDSVSTEILNQSPLVDTFFDYTPEELFSFADKYYSKNRVNELGDSEPIYAKPSVEYGFETDDKEEILEYLFALHENSTPLYKIPAEWFLETGFSKGPIESYRTYDGDMYLKQSQLREILMEQLIIQLSDRFPTPIPEEHSDRITTKSRTCEAQISTEKTLSIDTDEIMIEYLPPLLQSVYYRIMSKPETVSEDEYSVLFLTLSRVGFDSEQIADFVPFKTDIGKNYTLELINQSSLNRREPIPDWESIEEICHGVTQKKDGYRSVCQNPVMYYRLKGTFS